MATAMVKCRTSGQRRFYFLTSTGQQNRLRIHAAQFLDKDGATGEQRAQAFIDANAPDNPGTEWKVVA